MGQTVLVIDDTASLRRMLQEYLNAEGFRVLTADNGQQGLQTARKEAPDIILLDVMMPEMGGHEFMRIYRSEHETPIILLTAKLEETDKVVGLELGADDYVTKPFGMRELVARMRAVLRRSGASAPKRTVIRTRGIVLDRGQRRVEVRSVPVKLTPSEFELLATLMAAPGHVFFQSTASLRASRDGLSRGRANHRCSRAKLARQDRAECEESRIHRDGFRRRLPLHRRR